MSSVSEVLGEDWQYRDHIRKIELSIASIGKFLGKFEEHASYRLSQMEAKMEILERKYQLVEAVIY